MRDETLLHPLAWDGPPTQIEAQWLDGPADSALIVFLHEGLGSLSQWREFPHQLCQAAGCRGLVFSRPGYGRSTPRTQAWPNDYLQQQARKQMPVWLESVGVKAQEQLVLFGHSDGASLALLFAAYFPERVQALVAMAPHLFVEPCTTAGVQRARQSYERGALRSAMRRYHDDTDSAFYGWNDAWLRLGQEHWNIEAELRTLRCPVLAVQGVEDEYGTLAQIEAIQRLHPETGLLVLPDCGHVPQKDQPQAVIRGTLDLLSRL